MLLMMIETPPTMGLEFESTKTFKSSKWTKARLSIYHQQLHNIFFITFTHTRCSVVQMHSRQVFRISKIAKKLLVFRISKIAKKNDDYDDAVSGDITWPPWAAWLSLSHKQIKTNNLPMPTTLLLLSSSYIAVGELF